MPLSAEDAKELSNPDKVAMAAIDGMIADAIRVQAMRGYKTVQIQLSQYPQNVQAVIVGKLRDLGYKPETQAASGSITLSW